MLKEFNVTADMVKDSIHLGDPLLSIELRRHHKHEWSLFKARDALHIEYDTLEQHLAEIPHDRPIVIFSDFPGEESSDKAAQVLLKQGWTDVHKLVGGFDAYLEAGLPVEPVSKAVPATKIMWL